MDDPAQRRVVDYISGHSLSARKRQVKAEGAKATYWPCEVAAVAVMATEDRVGAVEAQALAGVKAQASAVMASLNSGAV